MQDQNIPPRLKQAIAQASPNKAAPGQGAQPAPARRPEDKKRLLSDVDRLLESIKGSGAAADILTPAPGVTTEEPVAPKPVTPDLVETTAAQPPSPPQAQPSAPQAKAPAIKVEEVTEPPPKTEGLRLDLFGAQPETTPFTVKPPETKLPAAVPAKKKRVVPAPPAKDDAAAQTITLRLDRPDSPAQTPAQAAENGHTREVEPKAKDESYEKVVERHGVVLKRVDMQMTTDLSPVPKVVPAEELLQKQKGAIAPEDVPEGQQRLQGFENDAPGERSEEELLREIKRSRAEHTSQFEALRHLTEKLDQNGETGAPTPSAPQTPVEEGEAPPFEYTEPKERESVLRALLQTQHRLLGGLLLQAALFIIACVLLGVSLAANGSASAALAANSELTLVELPLGQSLPQLLLLLGGLALNATALLRGAKGLFRRRPNADSLLLFAGVCVFAQSLLACFPGYGGYSYAALFLLLAAMQSAARWQRGRQNIHNFRFCAYRQARTLYALRTGEEVALGEGSAVRRQKAILYPAPMRFPAGFMAQASREDAMDQTARWLLPLAAGMAAIAALCGGLMAMHPGPAISAAAAALCLAIPAPGLLALYATLRGLNRPEKESDIAILGTGAADEISAAEGVVVDSGDLFRRNKGRMHGWREYWQVRTDEVLLYAAAIAIASGGPLQAVFEGVVEGDHSVLPKIHQLTFEDKMGLSCWIHNQKVFFGNRKLLENHGISVSLSERDELKYEHDGRKILYLAVDKRLTAFFVVSYKPDDALTPYFQRLRQEDRTLMVCNGDPSITLELLSGGFRLPSGSVELLRASQSEANRRRMRTPQAGPGASVYHADNIRSYLRAVTACLSLKGSVKRLRIFQVVGSLTAFLLLLLAALTKQLDYANSLVFAAFELIWAGICYAGAKN